MGNRRTRVTVAMVAIGATVVAALVGPSASLGARSTRTIAPEDHPSNITAYGGFAAWSSWDKVAQGYRLKLYDGQRTDVAPVPPREEPFDVDLGPDAQGRPVAVYSRCTDYTSPAFPTGCEIFRYYPGAGSEEPIPDVNTAATSESLPSIWRGRIAFVRGTPTRYFGQRSHPNVFVKRLGRGHARRVPPGPRSVSEEVGAVQLRGDSIAYVWYALRPGSAPSRARTSSFAAVDVRSSVRLVALGSRSSRAIERRRYTTFGPLFLTPSFEGPWLYYGYDTEERSQIRRAPLGGGPVEVTRAPEPLVSVGRDQGILYFLKGEDREPESGEPCSIGVTDNVSLPSKPRTCTVGLLTGETFR